MTVAKNNSRDRYLQCVELFYLPLLCASAWCEVIVSGNLVN